MRLAASTLGYRHDTLEVALTEIADAGFVEVDIAMIRSYCRHFDILDHGSEERAKLSSLLADLGLGVATLNIGDGLVGHPEHGQLALATARAGVILAKELGCYAVTMQSGVAADEDWTKTAARCASDFQALAAAADDQDIDLAIEIHKDLLVDTTERALALSQMVDHPRFGYTLDPSHLSHAGERADEAARVLGDLVRHVHLRDAIGKNIMVVPGDGHVDFEALGSALSEIGYNQAVTIELEYEHARPAEITVDLKRAKSVVEAAFSSSLNASSGRS